jgi:deoxyribonuclease V
VFLAIDVAYRIEHGAARARAAGVLFQAWGDEAALDDVIVEIVDVAPHEPGALFRRELPCVSAVLTAARAKGHAVDVVIIDAYVELAPGGARPGLGAVMHRELGIDVVGVATSRFTGSGAIEVKRGKSAAPLFVTTAGVDVMEAARGLKAMHGAHRLPTLLARVDALARGR